LPDEWVVLGNHRDAWVFGGVDPSSGTASLMEMTRAFGEMKGRGIRPRRTLVFCSWDGEEVGLTGSTEWGEQFQDVLQQKGVAYINVDSSVSGPDFSATLSASGAPLMVEVSKSIQVPSGTSLFDAWKESSRKAQNTILGARAAAATDEELPNTRIGSGSDHTVFLNHIGLPVFDLSFNGPYGVYHSMYDDHFWMERFGDPGFKYHALMSQVWGVLALRLGNAEVLPFDFSAYAANIRQYTDDLAAAQPLDGNLNLQLMQRRSVDMQDAGRALLETVRERLAAGGIAAAAATRLNRQIRQVEQNFLSPAGLPGRSWFKHVLYACRYTYAHLELPGLAEAVEAKDWPRAGEQAALIESALATNIALLREARETLVPPAAAGDVK
jgi:N-acetylated-alpha-linked acidic dipeptidase